MAQQLPSQLNSGTNIASYRQGSGGSFRQNSDMQLIESRYGRGSSKFTGETAKQFMRNSLEIPNINIDFQFENNC